MHHRQLYYLYIVLPGSLTAAQADVCLTCVISLVSHRRECVASLHLASRLLYSSIALPELFFCLFVDELGFLMLFNAVLKLTIFLAASSHG